MNNLLRFATAAVCGVALLAAAGNDSLKDILARMDQSAASFQTMTAQMDRVQHTAIINEDERDSATVRLKKTPAGLRGFVEFAPPNRRVVGFSNRTLQVFTPKTNTVEIYDLGKHGSQLDQFLLLGFGTSGKELKNAYQLNVTGMDTIAGRAATRMELIPKSKEAQDYLKKVELWIPQGSSHPIQEKIYKSADDYILISYSDVKVNSGLADQDLELRLPAGVKKVYPQK